MVTLQQLSDCGINPFAVQLLWESWNEHKTQPRRAIAFPFRDAVISIQDAEQYKLAPDRARQFKMMARNFAALATWPPEDTFERACGDVLCQKCGLKYFDHPQQDGLTLTCDGRLWKL